MRLRQPDERLLRRPVFRVVEVVSGPRQVADAGRALGIVVCPDQLSGDEALEAGEVRGGQREPARRAGPSAAAAAAGAGVVPNAGVPVPAKVMLCVPWVSVVMPLAWVSV